MADIFNQWGGDRAPLFVELGPLILLAIAWLGLQPRRRARSAAEKAGLETRTAADKPGISEDPYDL